MQKILSLVGYMLMGLGQNCLLSSSNKVQKFIPHLSGKPDGRGLPAQDVKSPAIAT